MLTGIHHVGYVFGDLEPHIAFYRERLGLEPTVRVDATEQMGIEIVVYRLGDGSSGVELIKPTREEGKFWDFLQQSGGGLHHVAYATGPALAEVAGELPYQGFTVTTNGAVDSPAGWRIISVDPALSMGLLTQLAER
ncbi:MAG: hypothetical protein CL878_15250 [Dehalococcoidia bacterium]|nr:hypothetical protein [Dehalococcoidia bacterium]